MIRITDDEDDQSIFQDQSPPVIDKTNEPSQSKKVKKERIKHGATDLPAVIYRSKTGQKISREEYLKERGLNENFEKSRPSPKKNVIYEKDLQWGGGLVQKREIQNIRKQQEDTIAQSLHSSEIVGSLDVELRQAVRLDDPLLQIKRLEQGLSPKSSSLEAGTPSGGFQGHIAEKGSRCPFPTPPNRFNIQAGSRWDGRVRGTGFEQKILEAINEARSGG